MRATSTLSRFDVAENVVIVASQKRPLGGRELQLPSMSMLTSKTSTQKFFLRVLQVIIQLRDDTRRANKKAKQTGRLGMELGCPVEGQVWWWKNKRPRRAGLNVVSPSCLTFSKGSDDPFLKCWWLYSVSDSSRLHGKFH